VQAGVLAAGAASTLSAPTGGVITAGSGSIAQAGALTTITQASPRLSLTWSSFNIPAQDTVDFVQPSASAIAVNRILDVNGTQILGQLNANGQVYLINPNGIVFGPGAEVNVGGLVASTLALDAASLPGDAQSFSGDGTGGGAAGTGTIIKPGAIQAASGGYVALLAQQVGNSGVISAQLGTVALGAGSAATLKFQGTHLVSMQVDQSVLHSVADNGGLIRADGGQVLMSAGAERALLASVVNNTGVIEARTLDHQQGSIILRGGMVAGTVDVAGTLDASAPDGGNGGAIQTSAAHVLIADSAHVTTAAAMGLAGSWLIDPTDFTIAASGGDESGATLSAALANGNVAIASSAGATGTSGDINVNDTLTWSANTLTLSAQNNININSAMNGSGTANLALQYGQGAVAAGNLSTYIVNAPVNLPAGPHFSTLLGSDGTVMNYTVITELGLQGSTTGTDLQGINGSLQINYALGANIDATATANWNAGAGFSPIDIPVSTGVFSGVFDGLGHTINNLTINEPYGPAQRTYFVGLFSQTSTTAIFRNIGLVNASVYGDSNVGGLVGGNSGSIVNCYVTGSVISGNKIAGGLVATNFGTITDSYSSAAVASYGVGHLVGSNVGGLAAINRGTITASYSSGSSYGYGVYVGGLVGNNVGAIINGYSTATVNGHSYVGGLVGNNYDPSSIGGTGPPGNITNSYSTGSVSFNTGGNFAGAGTFLGGLLGSNSGGGVVTNSFWDTATSGRTTSSGGGVGMTTAQMQAALNFTSAQTANGSVNPGWDLSTVASATSTWFMYEGDTYPLLRTFMSPLTVTALDAMTTYNGTAYSGGNGYSAIPVIGDTIVSGVPIYGGSSQGAIHAGSYAITLGGLYSDQQGYVLSFANGTLSVNPAPLTVSGTTVASKVYDGSNVAMLGGGTLSGFIGSDTGTLVQSGTFASKNAGSGIAVTATDTLTGTSADDYVVTQPTGLAANITPAPLTVSGTIVDSKVYNGTTVATLTGGSLLGLIGGDTVTLSEVGTFASRNAGTAIAVSVSDSLGGASASDYRLSEPAGLTGNIVPASLTVRGTVVGDKVYDGNTNALLLDGTLSGVIPGDSVTLIQAGSFASASVGTAIAVTAADRLSGPSSADYSVIQPTGLSGTISAASAGNSSGTPGSSGGAGSPLLAAYNASAQIDANSLAPQWGATPQVVDASSSIDVVETASEPASTDAGVDQDSASSSTAGGVVINVAMKIGATGTLKVESGGLRLPITNVHGNPLP
jgi:filamentous hemagglutinin family protein